MVSNASDRQTLRSLSLRRAVRTVLGGFAGALSLGLPSHPAVSAPPLPTLPKSPTYSAPAANTLPQPLTSSPPSGAKLAYAGNQLTVTQSAPNVSLNWASFDIGSSASVNFKQPSSSAVALNRIFQASPTQIFGALTSNGQVYLINPNGIIFGRTSTVNVGGLLASTLSIAPAAEQKGLLDPSILGNKLPALSSDGRAGVTDLAGNLVLGADGNPLPVEIVVQQGASLSTKAANQRLLLAAPVIENSGSLVAADGQVILAAGSKVYLNASSDPNLRGLLVEVDGGGVATNQLGGLLSADRGNISVVGLAVNQLGRVSASTSVTENGSIFLRARDTVSVVNGANGSTLFTQRGGKVTLGSGSVTEVRPDASGGTTFDSVAQPQSLIGISGQTVAFQSASVTRATGGAVAVSAASNPSQTSGVTDDARLRVDAGAIIDVSGSTATVPVTRNIVEVQLRGSELADDPLQRNGFLYQKTVFVDARVGTPIANVSAEVALTPRDIYERTSAGGSVTLASTGDAVIASGASINVSGGAVDYTPGYLQTTKLLTAGGSVVDIGAASPDQVYVGLFGPSIKQVSDRWGVITTVPTSNIGKYDSGYVQGASAGSVTVTASGSMVLQGSLQAATEAGAYQRTPATLPKGGQLVIGAPGDVNDQRSQAIDIVSVPTPVAVADDVSLPTQLALELPLQQIIDGGFSRISLGSNVGVTLAAATPLQLPAGGSLTVTAPHIDLLSSIAAPAGALSFASQLPLFAIGTVPSSALGVNVADAVTFDVRGNWVNDALLPPQVVPTAPVLLTGGSISLNGGGGTLAVGNGVAFEASGGAWLGRNGKFAAGSGGSISLAEGPAGTLVLGDGIRLDAYGAEGASGGSFSLSAPRIQVQSGAGPWATAGTVSADSVAGSALTIGRALFTDYGFSNISLLADGPRLAADPTATTLSVSAAPGGSGLINVAPLTLGLGNDLFSVASTNEFASIRSAQATPAYLAKPSTVSFSALLAPTISWTPDQIGGITIDSGVHLQVSPGGSVKLSTVGSTLLNGTISAPGGAISALTLTPGALYDLGYTPDRRIEIGATGVLDVSGTTVRTPNTAGLQKGTVYSGGSIDLHANRGSILVDSGAQLDFHGARAELDVQVPAIGAAPLRQMVSSSGGSLTLSAPESISLLGAVSGAGGGAGAAGGSVNVTLSRVDGFQSNQHDFPSDPRVLEFVAPGATLSPARGPNALDAASLAASGIDALYASADKVKLDAGANLDFARSVTLRTPLVGVQGTATVKAPYVSLGAGSTQLLRAASTPGTGALSVLGTEGMDIAGDLAFDGAGSVSLATGGALQLTGNFIAGDIPAVGQLRIAGDLGLSARVVTPTTGTNYTINASGGASNTVAVLQAGLQPGTPLSVGASLTINADTINQAGSLWAPFGRITLNATRDLHAAAGSLTSVSAAGATLPYGIVEGGKQWVYGIIEALAVPISGIPTRRITLSAQSVTLASGAVVDLSGGGDLYAHQWIPGPGGTSDVLSASVSTGLYAILPSMAGQYAPYDPLAFEGSTLTAGRSIYLSGGAGIAAGYYPLLPARYALLPGALLVSTVPGYANLVAGTVVRTPAGAPIISGYFSFGDTGIGANQTQGFLVEPGSYSHQLAQYQDNLASGFFAASARSLGLPVPSLPADAGTLAILASTLTSAHGTVNLAGSAGGFGGLVEIASPTWITVGGPQSPVTAGVITLDSGVLQSWKPGRVLLGGTYTDANHIEVASTNVNVDPGASLVLPEVVMVATQGISVAGGASIESTSYGAAAPAAELISKPLTLLNGGAVSGAAFLGVSDLTALTPSGQGGGGIAASVNVAAGSIVGSRGSIALNAPGGASIGDGTLSGNGAAWTLGGAAQVVFGSTAAAGALAIDPSLAAAMGNARSVDISTSGSIVFQGALEFGAGGAGAAPLASLTLSGSEYRYDATAQTNAPAAGLVRFTADSIHLGGTNAATSGSAGAATLEFDASSLSVGPGFVAANGFANVLLSAKGGVAGVGVGGLSSGADLTVNAGYVTALARSNTTLSAGGALRLSAVGNAPPRASLSPGGTLSLAGQSVAINAPVLAPSGVVAIGSRTSITLGSKAVVDVGGVPLQGVLSLTGTPGGMVRMNAVGDLSLAAGSIIEVGGANGASAGVLSLVATGRADLQGTLDARGTAGAAGSGDVYVSAGSLANFTALNAALETGGFDDVRSIRAATGDITLGAGETITARDVHLEADGGNISINGRIVASGTGSRPMVALDAGSNLTIGSTAVIAADALDANTKGGSIQLSAKSGTLGVDPGARLSANAGAIPGVLTLRAPTLGNDIAVSALPTGASAFGSVVIEPWLNFALSSGAPTIREFTTDAASVSRYISAAGAPIATRLGLGVNGRISPFIEFSFDGNVNLGSLALNTSAWRFGGQPGTVAVVASGNLTVGGTISDGFTTVTNRAPASTHLDLGTGRSSSILLTAGAMLGSAAPQSVSFDAAADLTLSPNAIVRTGTGDITLTASRDLAFGSGASVYTGGVPGAPTINNARPTKTLPAVFASFPTGGGSIDLYASRDVIAPGVTGTVGDWQSRLYDPVSGSALWGTDAARFNWTVGTLGGGDVSVRAGRDITDLSAAAADNEQPGVNGALTYFGAGNLSITAGRDLTSGYLYVARGNGVLRAFGSMPGNRIDPNGGSAVGTLLVSGDSSYRVQAVGDVLLEGDVQASTIFNGGAIPETDFYRYTANDSLKVSSAGGDIALRLAGTGLDGLLGVQAAHRTDIGFLTTLPPTTEVVAAAGNVALQSAGPVIFPSDRGQLVLYAAKNVTSDPGVVTVMSDAPGSGVATAALPGGDSQLTGARSARHTGDTVPLTIYAGEDIRSLALTSPKSVNLIAGHDIVDLVLNATNPNPNDVSLVSAGGSVRTTFANLNSGMQIAGGGAFDMVAGKNIDLGFSRGITSVGSLTNSFLTTTTGANITVLAGLGAPLGVDAPKTGVHQDFVADVIGGSLDPLTGKPLYQQLLLDYVAAQGSTAATFDAAANDFRALPLVRQLPLLSQVLFAELVRSGREYNTLPSGASSTGASGLLGAALSQSNLTKLIDNLISPSPVYRQQLVSYVEGATGRSGLDYATAVSAFEKFPVALQVAFRYVRGYTAISELFPGTDPFAALINHVVTTDPTIVAENAAAGSVKPFPGISSVPANPFSGDFSMTLGRVYTLQGGSIDILAPGGSIDVGLATTPPSVSQQGIVRKASDLGIVAEGAGDVSILTAGDVAVNSSRVFTLGGGNIAVWSSAGSIDAGRGAKTALSAPPPIITVDASGAVNVDSGAAVAGSGIRTVITNPNQSPGDVDLVAPIGTVNAGDAGIGASGNLNIAAASVAGLSNISVGGSSTGVPAVTSGVGVTVAAAAGAASSSSASSGASVGSAAESREQKAPLAQAALSWLDVFVVGLGEETCRPDDLDCLKRQPHK